MYFLKLLIIDNIMTNDAHIQSSIFNLSIPSLSHLSITSNAQVLNLALYSRISPGGGMGTDVMAR